MDERAAEPERNEMDFLRRIKLACFDGLRDFRLEALLMTDGNVDDIVAAERLVVDSFVPTSTRSKLTVGVDLGRLDGVLGDRSSVMFSVPSKLVTDRLLDADLDLEVIRTKKSHRRRHQQRIGMKE
jgi:hypothetical protein